MHGFRKSTKHLLPQQLAVGFQLRPHFDSTTQPPVGTSDKVVQVPEPLGHTGRNTIKCYRRNGPSRGRICELFQLVMDVNIAGELGMEIDPLITSLPGITTITKPAEMQFFRPSEVILCQYR